MAYIVKKRDHWGSWVDMLVTQEGYPAYEYYKQIEKREGKNNTFVLHH